MRHWRSFIVLCASLLIIAGAAAPRVQGCGYSPYASLRPNELASYHISFFPIALGNEKLLKAFAFRVHGDALEGFYDNASPEPSSDEAIAAANLAEWESFLGRRADKEAIGEIVYKRDAKQLEGIYERLRAGRPAGDGNKMLAELIKAKDLQTLAYIIYAKRCERFAAYTGSPWDFADEIAKIRNPAAMRPLIEEGLKAYAAAGSRFLRLRYAYQIVRLAHYARLYEDCAKYFDTLVPGQADSSVYYYQAMRHKAGALYQLGRKDEAMLLFSLVFDQCPVLLYPAYLDMKRLDPGDWQACLRLASNPHRQATLWLIRSLQDEDRLNMEPLARMYELEPRSPRLEFMLVRQINKLEKTLLTSGFFMPGGGTDPVKSRYIQDLLGFVQSVDTASIRRPALWQSAAAYLNLLLRQYDETEAALQKAAAAKPDEILRGEIVLLRSLSALAQAGKMQDTLAEACLPSLQWLAPMQKEGNYALIRRSLLIIMAQKYFQAGQADAGLCCLDNTGYPDLVNGLLINTTADYTEKMIAYAAKTGKTKSETYLVRGMSLSLDELHCLLADKFIRMGRFDEALVQLGQVSAKLSTPLVETSFAQNYYNPRTGLYRSEKYQLARMGQFTFIKRVCDLLAAAKKEPAKADVCYYQIANGFFQSPGWSFYREKGWYPAFVSSEPNPDYPFYGPSPLPKAPLEPIFKDIAQPEENSWYPTRIFAWQYYEKALSVTKNRELAAECCFLAAACQDRFGFLNGYAPKGKGQDYYYKLLGSKYKDTKYYQKVIKECADLRAYLGK